MYTCNGLQVLKAEIWFKISDIICIIQENRVSFNFYVLYILKCYKNSCFSILFSSCYLCFVSFLIIYAVYCIIFLFMLLWAFFFWKSSFPTYLRGLKLTTFYVRKNALHSCSTLYYKHCSYLNTNIFQLIWLLELLRVYYSSLQSTWENTIHLWCVTWSFAIIFPLVGI